MSWNIHAVGTPGSLRTLVQQDTYMPPAVREAIADALIFSVPEDKVVCLETFGHVERIIPQRVGEALRDAFTHGGFDLKVRILQKAGDSSI